MSESRGRITITEIVTAVFVLAAIRGLWPVVIDSLEGALPMLSVGETYLFRLLLPLMILVMFGAIYITSGQGAR